MNRQDFGRATEARFLLDGHRNGYIVSRPFDSVPGYDAILDNGKRLFRVQVKGARVSTARSVYRINTNRHRCRGPKFDYVAVWLDNDSRWIFLPGSVRSKHMVTITAHGKHSHRSWEVFRRR
jgi:hypothetical protein